MKDEEQKYWKSLLVAEVSFRVHPLDYDDYVIYSQRVPQNLREIRKTRELNEIFSVVGIKRKNLCVKFLTFWYGHDDVFDDVLRILHEKNTSSTKKPMAYRANQLASCIGIHNDIIKGKSLEKACEDMAFDLNDGNTWHSYKKLYQESLLSRIPNQIEPNASIGDIRKQIIGFTFGKDFVDLVPELIVKEVDDPEKLHEIDEQYPKANSPNAQQFPLDYGKI